MRPSQRWKRGARLSSARESSSRHAGNAKAAAHTCTFKAPVHSASLGSGSFSSMNGGSSSASKYTRLDTVMAAEPSIITRKNNGRSARMSR